MKKAGLAFLAYSVITIALTYPLVLRLGTVLPNDAGDPALNTWILWWNTEAVPLTTTWWNAPAFYPAPGVLSFSENLLGLSVVATPLHWLGAGPQTAYNVVFLLTFSLSALGAYLLGYELTRRHDAAFVAGLLFGFAPYRIAHLPQIQTLASFPMPFALLGLHRYLQDARPRWLVLFGAGWFLQGICNGYYLLFSSVLVGIWIVWFASPWDRWRQFLAITAAWVVAAIPMLPLLLRYRSTHASFGFVRELETIREFAADVASLLHATGHLALWGSLAVFRRPEGELFPGLTMTILVIAGALFVRDSHGSRVRRWGLVRGVILVVTALTALVSLSAVAMGSWRLEVFGLRLLSVANPSTPLTFSLVLASGLALTSPGLRRAYMARSALPFYAMAGFVMWLFSLGPAPTLMGNEVMRNGPYALLMYLPGFNALRVPARFWMMATICLAVVGALVFDRLASRFGWNRIAAAAIVTIGVLSDTWLSSMPLEETPKPFRALGCAGGPKGAVVELPLGNTYADAAAMYRQMTHHQPVVNGYSGYVPPHYIPLRYGLTMREPDVLTVLASHGVTDLIVDREPDPKGHWDKYVLSNPNARLVCTEGGQTLFRLTPPAPAHATGVTDHQLAVALIRVNINEGGVLSMVDRDSSTRWESGPQSDLTVVELDLGAVRTVTGIDLALGRYISDFPRGLRISASQDGKTWTEIWQGGSAGLALEAAFDVVPLRYRFAPTPARLLRMQSTKNDVTYYWSIAELRVMGPQP